MASFSNRDGLLGDGCSRQSLNTRRMGEVAPTRGLGSFSEDDENDGEEGSMVVVVASGAWMVVDR